MKRGDVVELDWPFSDRSGAKVRPALVVQADYLDRITDDRILVRIGSKIHGITGTEVILDPAHEPLSGLRKKCIAACADILTFDQSLILADRRPLGCDDARGGRVPEIGAGTYINEHRPFVVALSGPLNVEEAELADLPDNVVRFRNMPLPEEIVKRAERLLE